jgi:acyl carrier protein
MDDLIQQLTELTRRRFGASAEALKPDDDLFEVLGIDSLQALELLTDLEDTFDVEVPDYEVRGVNTIRGLATLLSRRL